MPDIPPLTPNLRKLLQQALTAAFDPPGLLRFATERLAFDDVKFADEVDFRQPKSQIVFQMVQVAEQYARAGELVLAIREARPRRPDVRGLVKTFGLEPEVRSEAAGVADPQVNAVDGLERTIKSRLPSFDFAVWREKMAQVEERVCVVRIDGYAAGTGFLVGPDAVLTNHHVLEDVFSGLMKPNLVTCAFDYKVLPGGARMNATVVGLHSEQWLWDACPPAAEEKTRTPEKAAPTADEMDYALVRLERRIGDEPSLSRIVGSQAPSRGWIVVPSDPPAFAEKSPLLIAQHPDGRPLKLSIDTEAVIGVNANRTRVRYTNNTEAGSSGSPVFDMNWSLAALHHLGDPAYDHPPSYNQGVPIDRVYDRIKRQGCESALGR